MATKTLLGSLNPAKVVAILAVLLLAYTFVGGSTSFVGAAIKAYPAVPQIEIPGSSTYDIGQTVSVFGGNLQANHMYELRLGEKFVGYITTDAKGKFAHTFEITEDLSPKKFTTLRLTLLDGSRVVAGTPVHFDG